MLILVRLGYLVPEPAVHVYNIYIIQYYYILPLKLSSIFFFVECLIFVFYSSMFCIDSRAYVLFKLYA